MLSLLLDKTMEGGFISGCTMGGREEEGMVISHLIYADDTLLFCQPKPDQLVFVRWDVV